MTDIKLEFDTPQFLHDLFANDLSNLSHLETALGVEAVTRDGWLRLSGTASNARIRVVIGTLRRH